MASTSDNAMQPLEFSGPPCRLRLAGLLISLVEKAHLLIPAALSKDGEPEKVQAGVLQRAGGVHVHAQLAPDTPPGEYPTQMQIDGATHEVTLRVEAAPRLRARPNRSVFGGHPGGAAKATVTLVNLGNVSIDIPDVAVVGMYDNDGLEEAFAGVYRQESNDPLFLIGHLIRGLREGSGGLLKLRLDPGAGELAPGAERVVTFKTNLPEKLKPGHSYHGVWKLGPMHHSIGINVHRG